MKCPRCSLDNSPQSRFCADCGTRLTGTPPDSTVPETLTMATPEERFHTGAVIAGRYQVIEELGRGGMGRVYKVLDQAVQEKIALKIINPEIAYKQSNLTRFRNELKLARQISHRNVCRTYDLGEDKGIHYITMEYVAGENLRKVIRMTGPLTMETAVSYARQICQGLAEAHKLGIIHRDLKPHNIMIDQEGTAKIMDFGLASSLQSEDLTGPGVRLGTPRYMAPEQVEAGETDARSDIYALGIILFEMVTGRLPFQDSSSGALIPPHVLIPSLPPELEAVILKCLEREPGRRYATSLALLAALEALPPGSPAPGDKAAVPTTVRAARHRRPRPLALVILAASLILLLGVAAILIFSPLPPKHSLAVLPFRGPGQGENQESLASSLADNIRTKLSGLSRLRVISELSSKQFQGDPTDIKDIRRRLGVDKIITGTLRQEGGGQWLNVTVTATEGLAAGWSRRYEFKPERQFQVENEVVLDVAEMLGIPVGGDVVQKLSLREPANQEAYRYFKWGESFQERYRESKSEADFAAALQNYEKAIGLDAKYALAFWGLGNLYEAKYVLSSEAKDLIEMLGNYEAAFQANPRLAEPYLGRGWALYYEQKFDLAYASFKEALRIHPDNPDVQLNAGSFLRSLGLFQEALKFYSAAISLNLDPLNTAPHSLMANCYCWQGEFDKAIDVLRKALSLDPNNPGLRLILARLHLHKGNTKDARKEIDAAERLSAGVQSLTRVKVWLLAAEGERQAALDLIPRLDFGFRYEVTNAYCLLGMREEAIRNISRGVELGFRDLKEYVYTYSYLLGNPLYDNLRSRPEFAAIVNAQKRLHLERREKFGGL